MNPTFSFLKLVPAVMAGAAFLSSCDKPEPVAVAPSPVTAPVPSITASPDAPPAAPAQMEPSLTGQAAIDAFKEEVKAIKAFVDANQGDTDPAIALANLRELIKRAAAVNTAGLPEDLASAYTSMNSVMQALQATMDDLPVPLEQLEQYTVAQKDKGGAAAEEVMAKRAAFEAAMASHQKDGEAASAKLKEVGAKYGVEALDITGN